MAAKNMVEFLKIRHILAAIFLSPKVHNFELVPKNINWTF